jgi:hypothetical protein
MTGQLGNDAEHDRAADLGQIDEAMEGLAAASGAELGRYPRPGQAGQRVVLREHRDDGGSQHEEAVLEADGTLRITGHDTGARVSAAFGPQVTSYEWVYVIPADRRASLVEALGGQAGDDVLSLLVAYYQRHGGYLSPVLTRPEVGAQFSNWHS